ncbi:methyltransferase domain-containing protein [Nitrospira defluvii]|nr:methyltransferase domain-containing protein [Nitrospira defluvii]
MADALIERADISEGDSVLDVASGTGEPSLTMARRFRHRNLEMIGVDGAEAMVKRANEKAEDEGLSNLCFRHMKAENLMFSSEKFDRVISRFGLMLFDDPLGCVKEMYRVLKKDTKISLAVWGAFHRIQSIYLIWSLLMKKIPRNEHPLPPRMGKLGLPGALEALLKKGGFRDIEITPFKLVYRFENFESYWSISTISGVLEEPFRRFSPSEQAAIKREVEVQCRLYQKEGRLVFQNEAILALAKK